jgi:chitinase
MREQADRLRESHVDLTVSTGGANGTYLEQVCGSPSELAAAYTTALDSVGARRLDVDVEADVDPDLVVAALGELQRRRPTEVSLTLPVAGPETGLEPDAVELVRRTDTAGVDATVNAMLMNFLPAEDWAQQMTRAAETTAGQIGGYSRLELTLMIGRNDMGMTTAIDDALHVRDFAAEQGIRRLGLWSLARDNGGCPGRLQAAPECSGLAQDGYSFTTLLTAGTDR